MAGRSLKPDRAEDGIAEMKTGLVYFEDASSPSAASNSISHRFMKSFLLSLLGETYGNLGRSEEAFAQFDTAWSFAEATGEAFWKAELQRLRGELFLKVGSRPSGSTCQEAEACFLQAREIASAQGARALELRAAISLGRLWSREKPSEARQILQQSYGAFTEGFDSVDLQEARRLLDELRGEMRAGL